MMKRPESIMWEEGDSMKLVIDAERTAKNIRKYMNMYGYSVTDICKKLGLTRGAFYVWARGSSAPSINVLITLRSLFKVSLDDLIIVKEVEENEGH